MATNRLGTRVKPYFEKARESALLAIEVYNKPGTKFKSAAYIALMVIAWTSLLHAIFVKQGKKPYKKQKNGKYEKVDEDYRHWGLADCANNYWDNDTSNPMRKNLEFFISLRNKIEHRQIPDLDSSIFGECQALLLNFDRLLGEHFDAKYQLREVLPFSLQMFPSGQSFTEAVKGNKDAKKLKKFIEDYRTMLGASVLASDQYAFKAIFIQVSNHQSADALPIQFIHYDRLSREQQDQLGKFVVAMKWKDPNVSDVDLLKPKGVVSAVQPRLGKKFTMYLHTLSWKRYSVRPPSGSKKPEATKPQFCRYNALHQGYGYTLEWVNFLVNKLKDESEYKALTAPK